MRVLITSHSLMTEQDQTWLRLLVAGHHEIAHALSRVGDDDETADNKSIDECNADYLGGMMFWLAASKHRWLPGNEDMDTLDAEIDAMFLEEGLGAGSEERGDYPDPMQRTMAFGKARSVLFAMSSAIRQKRSVGDSLAREFGLDEVDIEFVRGVADPGSWAIRRARKDCARAPKTVALSRDDMGVFVRTLDGLGSAIDAMIEEEEYAASYGPEDESDSERVKPLSTAQIIKMARDAGREARLVVEAVADSMGCKMVLTQILALDRDIEEMNSDLRLVCEGWLEEQGYAVAATSASDTLEVPGEGGMRTLLQVDGSRRNYDEENGWVDGNDLDIRLYMRDRTPPLTEAGRARLRSMVIALIHCPD